MMNIDLGQMQSQPFSTNLLQNTDLKMNNLKMPSYLSPSAVYLQKIDHPAFQDLTVYLLRMDLLDHVISGNKYFKLVAYLEDAMQKGFRQIGSFGGPFSNHLVALSKFAHLYEYQSTNVHPFIKFQGCKGIVRGKLKKNHQLSQTLAECVSYGMQLSFVDHLQYDGQLNKENLKAADPDVYWINEGGYGVLGAEGFRQIKPWIDPSFDHLLCASGTGTTAAGLLKVAEPHQKVHAFSIVGGHETLRHEIEQLLLANEQDRKQQLYTYLGFEFGGYAKRDPQLIEWINTFWDQYQLPTDFIYTAKMMVAILKLVEQGHFQKNQKLLALHTGGIQGNRSIEKMLHFRYATYDQNDQTSS
jgi:1-aminocyclopropane-1-carboxylate deaminase